MLVKKIHIISGIGKEHRIPPVRIRCITDKCWQKMKKI